MRALRSLPLLFATILAAAAGCSRDDDAPRDGGRDSGGRDAGGGDDGGPSDGGTDAPPVEDGGPTDGGGDDDGGLLDAGDEDAGPPRDAGPLDACDDITDVTMRGIVYDGPRVPPGFYSDADEPMAYPSWVSPCSPDLDGTRDRARTMYGMAALTGAERTTEVFHEVDALSGGFTVHYRNTRCDFFDGTTLGGGPHDSADRPTLLAGYTWWLDYYNLGGSAIAAGVVESDGPPFTIHLCHLQTVFGDFGLCDEITLYDRTFTVTRDGVTSIAPDRMIRTIPGMCH